MMTTANNQNQLRTQSSWRAALPQQVLSWLPLSLFFPVGVMYAGVLLFALSLLISGDYAHKWQRIKASPMLLPVLALSAVTIVVALFQTRPVGEFWSAFWHYQTYLFLLPFLAVGTGVVDGKAGWQSRAQLVFFGGAIYAATLFYLGAAGLLPPTTLFRSYVVYEGNKSILLGILLAISAGWMLHAWRWHKDHQLLRLLALAYVVLALLLFAKTRTASLIFVLLCALILLRNLRLSWRSMLAIAGLGLLLAAAVRYVASLPPPATCITKLMVSEQHLNPGSILLQRGICTVHQIRDFNQGKKIAEDGMRLEIYQVTAAIIAEKPWTGHGIANWLLIYRERAKGMMSEAMTTPHNDYLLYSTELGVFGLLALVWILSQQLWVAKQMEHSEHPERAMLLAMLGVTMIVGAMFNAILRDGVFGMAFMILLAIPLAGVGKKLK
ncbi:O-antigen ligase family protein [Undibacterium sp. Ren11W]|uniref:O-antigen ligase family protein n=1 Tax=Undibacterium sp. Ren11W TaxID=3413045 RepID=UPI003BF079CD